MQLYAALAVFGTTVLILWHWPRINSSRPTVRFAALHSALAEELERTEAYLALPAFAHEGGRLAQPGSLALKLLALGVNTPNARDDESWLSILPALTAYASVGQLRNARKICSEKGETANA